MFKITLTDGTVLDNLELSGGNFVTKTEISKEIFDNNLYGVKIECSDENYDDTYGLLGTHDAMKLVAMAGYGDGTWIFYIADLTEADRKEIELDARISYLEMLNS